MNTKIVQIARLLLLSFLFSLGEVVLIEPVYASGAETRTLVVSAYYSPLPGQSRYSTGTYAGDIRLNGNGTNGADGTEVYPGMLAAPKTYSFGTQVFVPGLGVGTVHDRGGAINAYEGYDRIDVWMGWGEEGLIRALQWGKRRIVGTVYFGGAGLENNIYLAEVEVPVSSAFVAGVGEGESGIHVHAIQKALVSAGYLEDTNVNSVYDAATVDAVYRLQLDAKLVSSTTDTAAGYFGAKTRQALEDALEGIVLTDRVVVDTELACSVDFCFNLVPGDSGERVQKLQTKLKELGYFDFEVTGSYGEMTTEAVRKFQLAYGVIGHEWEYGAGSFGPKTRSALNKLSDGETVEKIVAKEEFSEDLKLGDAGSAVLNLQKFLQEEDLFDGEVAGYYGELTRQSVISFQTKEGLVGVTAGVLDTTTRARMNEVVAMRENGTQILFGETNEQVPLPVLVSRLENQTLKSGDATEAVANLQTALAKLDYFEGEATGTFDENTKQAVIDFQIANGLIKSQYSPGAGQVGPMTRAKLTELSQIS